MSTHFVVDGASQIPPTRYLYMMIFIYKDHAHRPKFEMTMEVYFYEEENWLVRALFTVLWSNLCTAHRLCIRSGKYFDVFQRNLSRNNTRHYCGVCLVSLFAHGLVESCNNCSKQCDVRSAIRLSWLQKVEWLSFQWPVGTYTSWFYSVCWEEQ